MHSTSLIADIIGVAWLVAVLLCVGGLVVAVASSRRNRGYTDPAFEALIKAKRAELLAAARGQHQRQRP